MASSTPSEIGTSMFNARPAGPRAPTKEGLTRIRDWQRDQGRHPMEEVAHRAVHVSISPDQTDTDSNMMLAAAKPATPSLGTSSSVRLRDAAVSGLDQFGRGVSDLLEHACEIVRADLIAVFPARDGAITLCEDRLARAAATPLTFLSAASTILMHRPHTMSGTESAIVCTASCRASVAACGSAAGALRVASIAAPSTDRRHHGVRRQRDWQRATVPRRLRQGPAARPRMIRYLLP